MEKMKAKHDGKWHKITGWYRYRTENGDVAYYKARIDPAPKVKEFMMFHEPKPGKFKPGRNGPSLLYALNVLHVTPHDELIFWVEGEKDVHTLMDLGLTATCNDGGGGKGRFKVEWAQHFKGRTVYILRDNDKPGEELAQEVHAALQGVAELAVRVELPRIEDKGEDVTDWLQRRGGSKGELLELCEAAARKARIAGDQGDAFEPIEDREQEGGDDGEDDEIAPSILAQNWRPFPIDLFPTMLKEFAIVGAQSIQCDPSLLALNMIPAFMALIGTSRSAQAKVSWLEPMVAWSCVLAYPSSGKTPAFVAATSPIVAVQREMAARHVTAKAEYLRDLQHYLRPMKKDSLPRSKHDPDAPEEPSPSTMLIDDITVEAVFDLCSTNPHGLVLLNDELKSWFTSFARYRTAGAAGGDDAFWCRCWNASSGSVHRKTSQRSSTFVERMSVSIGGCIQPDIMRGFAQSNFFESGLAARFLWAMPPKHRRDWSEAEIPPQVKADYEALGVRIYHRSIAIKERNGGSPAPIPLSPGAKELFIGFYRRLAELQFNSQGVMSYALPKLEAYTLRLAAWIAIVENAQVESDAEAICEADMARAIHLIDWFRFETERVYSVLTGTRETGESASLIDWIRAKGGSVKAVEVFRSNPQRWRTTKHARTMLDDLATKNIGTWIVGSTTEKGGRPSRTFVLNESLILPASINRQEKPSA